MVRGYNKHKHPFTRKSYSGITFTTFILCLTRQVRIWVMGGGIESLKIHFMLLLCAFATNGKTDDVLMCNMSTRTPFFLLFFLGLKENKNVDYKLGGPPISGSCSISRPGRGQNTTPPDMDRNDWLIIRKAGETFTGAQVFQFLTWTVWCVSHEILR